MTVVHSGDQARQGDKARPCLKKDLTVSACISLFVNRVHAQMYSTQYWGRGTADTQHLFIPHETEVSGRD